MEKLPGKTRFSGRRRSATRKSGFHAHEESTGGEWKTERGQSIAVEAKSILRVSLSIAPHKSGQFVGFGGWFNAPESCVVRVIAPAARRHTVTAPSAPNWSKFGSMWISDGSAFRAELVIECPRAAEVSLWGLSCGTIHHRHLDDARDALLSNMYQFSPEAHFYKDVGAVHVTVDGKRARLTAGSPITLKSCNRCARFLPINIHDERRQLSFSNHCVAEHRRPCTHTGFGKLRNVETDEVLELDYGYQLECRFCKKFEVNGKLNAQRTAAQMKEDGARRRFFELLLTELLGGSPQLLYKYKTGRELTDDVWKRFGKSCFSCGEKLRTPNDMHLDHTRPLALLWPLDETATALCESCNSQKRDRPPADYYTPEQLRSLAELVGIPLRELQDPSPNPKAIRLIRDRLDWLFGEFLLSPQLTKERDGKTASELVVKALQKALNRSPNGAPVDLVAELERRRAKK